MLEKGIISTRQFILMLFLIITSFTALHVPGLLIDQAGRDAWLSVLGGWFLDVLLAIVYAYLGLRFPGENFVQYSMSILGKKVGGIVGSLFPLFFLVVCSLLQTGLAYFIKFAFLPKMPFEMIILSGAMIIGYGAYRGIEVIGRVAEILGPLYFLSFIILIAMVLPVAEIDKLKPQFDEGFYPFLSGSPLILTFYGICIMMGMFIPINNRMENGFLAKFVAVSMGAFAVGAIVLLSIAVFGYDQVKHMLNPGLGLTRIITIGRFVERMEMVWMMIAVGAALMSSTMMIWAFSLGMSQIMSLKSYQPLVFPATILSSIMAVTSFDNHIEHIQFIQFTYPVFAAAIEAGLILFLLIAAIVLKKKGKAL